VWPPLRGRLRWRVCGRRGETEGQREAWFRECLQRLKGQLPPDTASVAFPYLIGKSGRTRVLTMGSIWMCQRIRFPSQMAQRSLSRAGSWLWGLAC
jgi:hypothetical protein